MIQLKRPQWAQGARDRLGDVGRLRSARTEGVGGQDLGEWTGWNSSGGPERREIVIVPYRPVWPDLFEQNGARIVDALGGRAIRVYRPGTGCGCGRPVIGCSGLRSA